MPRTPSHRTHLRIGSLIGLVAVLVLAALGYLGLPVLPGSGSVAPVPGGMARAGRLAAPASPYAGDARVPSTVVMRDGVAGEAALPFLQVGFPRPRAIDYADPVAGGMVPLIRVRGQEHVKLSEHFSIGDFAASDGAPYARISLDLVDALEALQDTLGVPLYVNSGYRHPTLNFGERVDGAGESQHMAGLAADVWAPGKTPLEIAAAALDALDCAIGVGLGAGFVHVDVRGHLASWAREGAAMDEVAFDMWVLERCGAGEESELLAAADADSAGQVVSGPEAIERYRDEMAALARLMRRRQQRGAVLLDLRPDVPGRAADLDYRITYVDPYHAVAASLDLSPLMDHAEHSDNFVYVLVAPDGAQEIGIMTLNPLE